MTFPRIEFSHLAQLFFATLSLILIGSFLTLIHTLNSSTHTHKLNHEFQAYHLSASQIQNREKKSIFLEHANHYLEHIWGLMGRKKLETDHGLTFNLKRPQALNFWMFNCFIDLSVAYCDSNKVLREIYEMKSFPEKMQKTKQIQSVKELLKYPQKDPVYMFFKSLTQPSKEPRQYALEMNSKWFKKNNFQIGDVAFWNVSYRQGWIYPTINMSEQMLKKQNFIWITYDTPDQHCLWVPEFQKDCIAIFLDEKNQILDFFDLYPCPEKNKSPVAISPPNTSHILLAPKNQWEPPPSLMKGSKIVGPEKVRVPKENLKTFSFTTHPNN